MANQNRRKEVKGESVEFVEGRKGEWKGKENVWCLCVSPVKETKMSGMGGK